MPGLSVSGMHLVDKHAFVIRRVSATTDTVHGGRERVVSMGTVAEVDDGQERGRHQSVKVPFPNEGFAARLQAAPRDGNYSFP